MSLSAFQICFRSAFLNLLGSKFRSKTSFSLTVHVKQGLKVLFQKYIVLNVKSLMCNKNERSLNVTDVIVWIIENKHVLLTQKKVLFQKYIVFFLQNSNNTLVQIEGPFKICLCITSYYWPTFSYTQTPQAEKIKFAWRFVISKMSRKMSFNWKSLYKSQTAE